MTEQEQIKHLEKLAALHFKSALKASRTLPPFVALGKSRRMVIQGILEDASGCLTRAAYLRDRTDTPVQ